MELAVGVSQHITVDMLMGPDIPHFKRYLREALEADSPEDDDSIPLTPMATESSMVTTRANPGPARDRRTTRAGTG